jgi:hypothetical protein
MAGAFLRDRWSQARYRWDHGEGAWAAAHQLSDAALYGRHLRSLLTRTEPRLTVEYRGYAAGGQHVVPFLQEQLERVGSAVTLAEEPLTGWSRPAAAVQPDADIVFTACSSRRAAALPAARSLVLPFRIQQLLDVVPDPEAMVKKVSRNERKQFANLRGKREWSWEAGTRLADLEFFYERMHLPTMGWRYGAAMRSADWDTTLHCLFRRGALFFVNEGGKRVAGALCRYDDGGSVMRMRMLGVLDGDETHYRSGAVKAVWYLAVEWAASNGIRLIDMSGGEPFPGKGVYQFKRRFHPLTALPTDHFGRKRLHLAVRRDSAAVRDFLVATPMLAVDEAGRLSAVHFSDSTRPAHTRIAGKGPGIEECREIDLDEFLTTSRPPAPAWSEDLRAA